MANLNARQLAVGKCPKCGKHPDWFNDVPLRAFCWGDEETGEHPEMSRVVPGKAQPYGKGGKTKWLQTELGRPASDAFTKTKITVDNRGNNL